ncbi:MAG TPA: hypothetical protein VIJ47_06050, partial [Acidimicrobiales bacterium]
MTTESAVGRRRIPRARWVAAVAGFTALVVAGGVVWANRSTPSPPTVPPPVAAMAPVIVPAPAPPPVPARTTIAVVTGPVPYSAGPDGAAVGTIPVGSWWGETKALPVVAQAPGWLQVRLPQRPNGLTGWIPADRAVLSFTTYGVLIDVTAHRV